jgi:hypothetical protein
MIYYLSSKQWMGGGHEGWANGSLAASYDLETEPETDAYVKSVYKIFKRGALKLRYLNANTKEVHERPTSKFFAWPDAVHKYDQVNSQYLINNTMAYLTSKKLFIEQN